MGKHLKRIIQYIFLQNSTLKSMKEKSMQSFFKYLCILHRFKIIFGRLNVVTFLQELSPMSPTWTQFHIHSLQSHTQHFIYNRLNKLSYHFFPRALDHICTFTRYRYTKHRSNIMTHEKGSMLNNSDCIRRRVIFVSL